MKTFVLCFDGTGNKFSGTDSDSNILKIYHMLDRNNGGQYHYYQPGIGTYVTSNSLDHTTFYSRCYSKYLKAKDSAIGSSFSTHVMGGYKFLMRYYSPGDDIYIFGFSRGAYTARFLAEMLDHVGLLSAGNEELSRFAWKAFSKWQARTRGQSSKEKEKEADLHKFMRAFRETFSRPVKPIRFLGLFDTVNSVPRFENAWMSRTKFPYSVKSSAQVIRHAVAIDERRAKFRQDLLSETKLERQNTRWGDHHEVESMSSPNGLPSASDCKSDPTASPPPLTATHFGSYRESEKPDQDILELWFPGCHADIGGGWPKHSSETWPLSHNPLVWMVQEASAAGLLFNRRKVLELNCISSLHDVDPGHHTETFLQALHDSGQSGYIHDCLEIRGGLPILSVLSWKLMEYLPFRRMDLKKDGSWRPIRWPLPRGETRDIPNDAKFHCSVIRRIEVNERYRPGQVIIGGGGRGIRRAPAKYGMGRWEKGGYENDPVREYYVRGIQNGKTE